MKRFRFLFVLTLLFILTGCVSDEKIKSDLKNGADKYYNEYVYNKVTGLDKVEITLIDLKEEGLVSKNLKSCKDNTSVTLTIENNKIIDYEYNIDC